MNLAGFRTPATASRDTGEEDGSLKLIQVRLDGKAVRGARDAAGKQVRLLAALGGPTAPAATPPRRATPTPPPPRPPPRRRAARGSHALAARLSRRPAPWCQGRLRRRCASASRPL
jgi:hypothetical protein